MKYKDRGKIYSYNNVPPDKKMTKEEFIEWYNKPIIKDEKNKYLMARRER